jgi:hypothetical protein
MFLWLRGAEKLHKMRDPAACAEVGGVDADPHIRKRRVAHVPQDTFYWGMLKGVGKVYVQVVVDVLFSISVT